MKPPGWPRPARGHTARRPPGRWTTRRARSSRANCAPSSAWSCRSPGSRPRPSSARTARWPTWPASWRACPGGATTAVPPPSSTPTKSASTTTRPARASRPSACRAGAGHALGPFGLKTGYGRDDVGGDHLERGDLPDVGHRADRGAEAHLGEAAEPVDDLGRLLALRAHVEDEVAGLGDLVVVASLGVAVGAQHVQLASQVRAGEQVTGVGVLGHEAQRLLLPAAADHDRRMRPGQGLRRVQRPLELVVPAPVRALVAAPHLQADLQGFLEPLEAFGDGRESDAEPA